MHNERGCVDCKVPMHLTRSKAAATQADSSIINDLKEEWEDVVLLLRAMPDCIDLEVSLVNPSYHKELCFWRSRACGGKRSSTVNTTETLPATMGSRSDQAILWAVFRDSLFRMVEQNAQPREVGGGFTALISVSEVSRSRCSSLHTHDLRHHATSCKVAVGVQPKLVGLHLGSSPIYGTLPSCCNTRGELYS